MTFSFNGQYYPYYIHPHNSTATNERKVEIAIAKAFLGDTNPKDILEVGCVLPYYGHEGHLVLDPHDPHPAATHITYEDYDFGDMTFEKAIAISTYEHFGTGDYGKARPVDVLEQINSLNYLAAEWLITIPVGYNLELDRQLLYCHNDMFEEVCFMTRVSKDYWSQSYEYRGRYNYPYPYGNTILIAGRFNF